MEIKKGLSFSQAKENIKEHPAAFFGVLLGMVVLFFILLVLAEERILSENVAVGAAKGAFLGAIFFTWRIIKGDSKKK